MAQCHPDRTRLGANEPCLIQARKNFLEFGACEKRLIKYVRKPKEEEGDMEAEKEEPQQEQTRKTNG